MKDARTRDGTGRHPETEAARGHCFDPRPASRVRYRYDRTRTTTAQTTTRAVQRPGVRRPVPQILAVAASRHGVRLGRALLLELDADARRDAQFRPPRYGGLRRSLRWCSRRERSRCADEGARWPLHPNKLLQRHDRRLRLQRAWNVGYPLSRGSWGGPGTRWSPRACRCQANSARAAGGGAKYRR